MHRSLSHFVFLEQPTGLPFLPPNYMPFVRPLEGFPDSSVGKESTCNAGDPSSIPGSGRSAGEGIGYPLRVTKSWTRLNDVGQVCLKGVQVSFTFTQAFSQE